ncbi:MAG TPA: hypothetical protein VFC70_03395, partial [Oscillospiraceae bacterium]|nr:hypothetical protein [Oscillospiraceae bacterium]
MKKIVRVTFLILCLFFVTIQISLAEANYGDNTPWVMFPREANVPLNKEWSVIFNRAFSEYETGTMVIEKNSVPIPVEIKLQPGNKKAIISPINEYLPDTEYL